MHASNAETIYSAYLATKPRSGWQQIQAMKWLTCQQQKQGYSDKTMTSKNRLDVASETYRVISKLSAQTGR